MNIQECTTFTRWTTTSESKKLRGNVYVLCICQCGTQRYVREERLLSGVSKSCGCYARDILTTHGMTTKSDRKNSREYWVWNSMVQRCTNPKNRGFHNYGGRGISVCEAWAKFINFYSDMGERPSDKHSLDRVDNNKGYSPENCKWVERTAQARNKRNNRILVCEGESKTLAEWSELTGLNHATILLRIKHGWSVEMAINTPLNGAYRGILRIAKPTKS